MVEPVWLIDDADGRRGPYTAAQMREIAGRGGIDPDTPVRKVGMPEPVPARRVRGLLEDEFAGPVPTPATAASDNPFAGDATETPVTAEDRAEFVGFLPRAVAFLVDAMLVGLFFAVATAFELSQQRGGAMIDFYLDLVLYFLLLPMVLYWPVLEGMLAATPGKYLVGIQVVDRHGRPVGWGRAVLRNLVRWTAMIPIVFFVLDHLVIVLNRSHQSVHDMLAGTWCINPRRGGRNLEFEEEV